MWSSRNVFWTTKHSPDFPSAWGWVDNDWIIKIWRKQYKRSQLSTITESTILNLNLGPNMLPGTFEYICCELTFHITFFSVLCFHGNLDAWGQWSEYRCFSIPGKTVFFLLLEKESQVVFTSSGAVLLTLKAAHLNNWLHGLTFLRWSAVSLPDQLLA